jgi:hypothetical protein
MVLLGLLYLTPLFALFTVTAMVTRLVSPSDLRLAMAVARSGVLAPPGDEIRAGQLTDADKWGSQNGHEIKFCPLRLQRWAKTGCQWADRFSSMGR